MNVSDLIDSLKENAWIAALGLLVVAVFRDALKGALTKAVNSAGSAVYKRLAGSRVFRRRALANYRRGLVAATERIAVPFRPNRPLVLSDIFVSMRVAGDEGDEPLEVWDILSRHSRVVVTGPPGAGKSMLLRHLASTRVKGSGTGAQRERLPVLLELHRLVRAADAGESIEAHLVDAFDRNGFPRADKFVKIALERGWLVLLLDGLDEVPTAERPEVAKRMADFLTRHRSCQAIITCRTAVYRGEFNSTTDRIVELEPFEDQQIQAFLGSWNEPMPPGKSPGQLMTALREQPKLLTSARNPLLLTIITHLYSDSPSYVLPRSRAEFYRQAAAILLDQWQGHLGHNEFEGIEKRTILSQVALEMQEASDDVDQDRRTISREDAFERATKAMPGLGREPDQVGPIMREIIERSGLLLAIDGGSRYAFAHLTFQEYFSAEALLNHPAELLTQFEADPDAWREVVILWCGLAAESTALIERVREIDEEVALTCVAEAASVSQEVAEGILRPVIEKVVDGTADETLQRGLGAVAADVRSRGETVLKALLSSFERAGDPSARLSIATALAASNQEKAAMAIVRHLEDDRELAIQAVRLGDLAVPHLLLAARHSANPLICLSLANIGTPEAASALASIMVMGGPLETPAAWGVAKVVGNPMVASALEQPRIALGALRQRPSLDWVWLPFQQQKGDTPLRWIIGRAAMLIHETDDSRLAITTPDPRIGAALCAMAPNPLDTKLRIPPPGDPEKPDLLGVANEISRRVEFSYRGDGTVDAEVDGSSRGAPELRAGDRHVRLQTYRQLLRLVMDVLRSPRFAPSAGFDRFFALMLETMTHAPVWAHLAGGLPEGFRVTFLRRIVAGGEANRDTWPAVRTTVLFRFDRSPGYLVVLGIALILSLAALVQGVFILTEAESLFSIGSLLAAAACLVIVGTWAWMLFESDPADYVGVDQEVLWVAALGFFVAPIEVINDLRVSFDGEDLLPLVCVGFTPAVCWLAVGFCASLVSFSLAVILVATPIALGVAITLWGQWRERALQTPLTGLFLEGSGGGDAWFDYNIRSLRRSPLQVVTSLWP